MDRGPLHLPGCDLLFVHVDGAEDVDALGESIRDEVEIFTDLLIRPLPVTKDRELLHSIVVNHGLVVTSLIDKIPQACEADTDHLRQGGEVRILEEVG